MAVHPVSRRGFLATSGALMAWAYLPRIASAGPARDPRFVTIILRGALDGLATVAPVGDPDYERTRRGLVLPTSGPKAAVPLDGFFVLNPNLPGLAELYRKGEALIVQATATPYRERSHFDGQDMLESGQGGPGRLDSGWLNRALALLPKGEEVARRNGLAIGAAVPLLMRGRAPVVSLLPAGARGAPDDTRRRLLDLYRHTLPDLAERLDGALDLDEALGGDAGRRALDKVPEDAGGRQQVRAFHGAGVAAGKLLAKPDGPRLGAMSLLGWDTHQNESPVEGSLAKLLLALDATIDGLRTELGPAWSQTVVTVVTEFGRTVHMNGTSGTDHGTGGIALVVGGAVKGGRVIADWPGLTDRALFGGRDLAPTTDLRAVLKGLLGEHLGLSEAALAETVFPESAAIRPLRGLVA